MSKVTAKEAAEAIARHLPIGKTLTIQQIAKGIRAADTELSQTKAVTGSTATNPAKD